ncbi:10698_t:CDS:2, partial [Dentiscutata heterogama]
VLRQTPHFPLKAYIISTNIPFCHIGDKTFVVVDRYYLEGYTRSFLLLCDKIGSTVIFVESFEQQTPMPNANNLGDDMQVDMPQTKRARITSQSNGV